MSQIALANLQDIVDLREKYARYAPTDLVQHPAIVWLPYQVCMRACASCVIICVLTCSCSYVLYFVGRARVMRMARVGVRMIVCVLACIHKYTCSHIYGACTRLMCMHQMPAMP